MKMPKQHPKTLLSHAADLLEWLIAVILLIGVIIEGYSLCTELIQLSPTAIESESYLTFLGHALDVVIGVEFIKMLCKHTPGAVLEVLLFTLARQIIVSHGSSLETLFDILAIALLFIVRKFLFVHTFENREKMAKRAAADEPDKSAIPLRRTAAEAPQAETAATAEETAAEAEWTQAPHT